MEEIQLLEARLNELRVAYEKYFAGVEKIEPAQASRRGPEDGAQGPAPSTSPTRASSSSGIRLSPSSTPLPSIGTASSNRSRTEPTSAISSGCASRTRSGELPPRRRVPGRVRRPQNPQVRVPKPPDRGSPRRPSPRRRQGSRRRDRRIRIGLQEPVGGKKEARRADRQYQLQRPRVEPEEGSGGYQKEVQGLPGRLHD